MLSIRFIDKCTVICHMSGEACRKCLCLTLHVNKHTGSLLALACFSIYKKKTTQASKYFLCISVHEYQIQILVTHSTVSESFKVRLVLHSL